MLRQLTNRALLCLLPLAFCSAGLAHAQSPSAVESSAPTIRLARNPDPAPDFSLTDLAGKPLALAGLRGKVTLLNFWATWCGPCRAEIPDLIELQSKYSGKLQIVGLVVDVDSPDEVKQLIATSGINYPVAMAPDAVRSQYGGIAALPTSFLLDTEGRVVQKHVGLRDPVLYEREIRALLSLPIDAKVEAFDDTGQIFLANASRATELPGVDLSKLTPEQIEKALRRFNAESCTCGCTLTLAQCRMNDTACAVSLSMTGQIVAEISSGKASPAASSSASPAQKSPATLPAKNSPTAKKPQ